MATEDFSAQSLRKRLHYNPDTGIFVWVESNGRRAYKGSVAGSAGSRGYISISIDGHKYKAHRLAWLYTHGAWPKDCIDHINGNTSDNRIVNLRDVDRTTNQQNIRRAKINNIASGFLGVKRMQNTSRWYATIKLHGKSIYLGSHATPEEAHHAYLKAKRKLHQGCTI